ncbi:MAG TPA: hypothetical protein VFW23_01125 [Tepidisphaeraceae bacterium]|nr:hypothetical protein [Tepidisphaeraceae bacterium]
MTDPHQTPLSSEELALEAQLRSMAPVGLSTNMQISIKSRIERQPASFHRVQWVAAIAACVLIAMSLLILQHVRNQQPVPRSIQARNASTLQVDVANDDKQFAIATYRDALAQSPDSLDAILERQSRQAGSDDVSDSQIPRIGDLSIATP